jgi:hypothetical protein
MIEFMITIVLCTIGIVTTQQLFADGEAQRVYDLLDGLGCIGNPCFFQNFTIDNTCDYHGSLLLACDASGHVIQL